MKQLNITVKKHIFLIMFTSLLLLSCNRNNAIENNNYTLKSDNDSIQIEVKLPPKSYCGFNIRDSIFNLHYVSFENKTDKDTIITKRFPVCINNHTISYGVVVKSKSGFEILKHLYLLDKESYELEFTFNKGDIIIQDSSNVTILDNILSDYDAMHKQIHLSRGKNKENIKVKLDSLYNNFKIRYNSDNNQMLSKANEIYYIDKLQALYPDHEKVVKFIQNQNKDCLSNDLVIPIFINYIDNIKDDFAINNDDFSENSLHKLSVAMYHFLTREENRGKYLAANNWLRTTDFYHQNRSEVDKKITVPDNDKFRESLANLSLDNKKFDNVTFAEIIKQNPSEYYLLDFWATWCKPCMEGIKKMHTIDIPNNVKVINLSVDKLKNREEWRDVANSTQQELSYLITNSNKNKAFLKFIELSAIPRYILLDKDLNPVDWSFPLPSESTFQKRLNAL